jgi:hypothetical protein
MTIQQVGDTVGIFAQLSLKENTGMLPIFLESSNFVKKKEKGSTTSLQSSVISFHVGRG